MAGQAASTTGETCASCCALALQAAHTFFLPLCMAALGMLARIQVWPSLLLPTCRTH
jgi:hypothetical protein